MGLGGAGDATPPGACRVEVTLEPDGDGTRLHLRHSGFLADAVQGHAEGWDHFLAGLVRAAADPG